MINITINIPQFEYDIHSLVKAFFPEHDVRIVMEDSTNSLLFVIMHRRYIKVFIEKKNELIVDLAEDISRPAYKNELKKAIYKVLEEYTGKTLPWGTLTGIRPTKIPMTMLLEGKTEADIYKDMKKAYLISSEKANLSIEIVKREKELLAKLHEKNGYSLYIGIPFCPTTCLYCSFTSYPICAWEARLEEYMQAFEKEISAAADICKENVLDTVYIGGGTPTTLSKEHLERMLSYVKEKFDFSHVLEFTVEAGRADSITREKLEVLKKHGVTRISINPQTMKQETLDVIGRKHTVSQVKEAFFLAREVGFTNINMDLIIGLPGETKEDVAATMREIQMLAPDSLTVHSLAVKRASALALLMKEKNISLNESTSEMMDITADSARQMHLEPYYLYRQKNMSGNLENVGYAREGAYGLYNILIMEEKQPIMALGPGSISKVIPKNREIKRCDNVKDIALYIERIDEMIERKRKLFVDAHTPRV